MATLSSVLIDISTLSKNDINVLKTHLAKMFIKPADSLEAAVRDERFSGGMVCPVCGCLHIVRNGHRKDGTQRYVCRDCRHSFVATTNTIAMYTKKDINTWEKYIDCMMNCFPLRKTANICGMNLKTAFYWRHKILGALQNMAGSVVLDGIVEADETFFPVSYKGNHNKSRAFVMPRPAHKRGHSTHIRGISKEKLCVPCAVNRNGLSIAKSASLGRISAKNLHAVYDGRLKKFFITFDGVSSKHLDNYLIWHNFVNYAPESDIDKRTILLRFVLTQNLIIHAEDISKKPALPFVA